MEYSWSSVVVRFGALDLYRVRLPLRQPWRAAGTQFNEVETLLMRVESPATKPMWVESTPFGAPVFTNEWAAASFQLARDHIGPLIHGKEFASAAALAETLSLFRGNSYAKALFDFAFWALRSTQEKTPISELLGSSRSSVEVSDTLGTFATIDDLLTALQLSVDAGYRAVKLKFTRAWGLEPLRAARSHFANLNVAIDCNAGFTRNDFDLFKEVDKLGLSLIEQPLGLDDDLAHAELAKMINSPICLDESASSFERVQQAAKLKACRLIHIKPARVGGLTAALKIHNFCLEQGLGCVIGSNLESAIGSEFTAALATLPAFQTPGTIFPSAKQFSEELANSPFLIKKNAAGFPAASASLHPGVEREPDPTLLKRFTVEHASL